MGKKLIPALADRTFMCGACSFSQNGHVCRIQGINWEEQIKRLEEGICRDAGIRVGGVIELRTRVLIDGAWSFKER